MAYLRINESNQNQKVIVMTGATSGIGLHAVKHLAHHIDHRILIGARSSNPDGTLGYEHFHLDLALLDSVRTFASEIIKAIGDEQIDVLILNAGMQAPTNEKRSVDGFEMTFAVNHLAHFLLIKLLLPHLAENGKLIIITSDTHDPEITPIAPKSLDIQALAHPVKTGFGTGIRAYAASKLCNIMTALHLADMEKVMTKNISVIAFNPGFTGGTSLGRDSSPTAKVIMKILINTVFRFVGLFKPEYVISTPEISGKALADIAMGSITPPDAHVYISMVKGISKYLEPSHLAQNKEAQQQLWRESESMVSRL